MFAATNRQYAEFVPTASTTKVDPGPEGAETADVRRRDLGVLVRTGVRWKIASGVIVQVTRIATAVVIARQLTPTDFGLAALVLVFSGLAMVLTDLSLGSALVQRPAIDEADRSTVFWTTVGMGILLTILFFAASWPVSSFYGEPSVQPLLAVYSVTFLVNGLSATQATLLRREMRFRSLELRLIVATLVAAVVGITAAVLGAGAWAIILQSLAYTTSSLPLLWVASSWRPRFMYSLASLRDLGGFGLNVLGAKLAAFVSNTTDTVLIGRVLGPASVGAYGIAFNLMLFPLSRIVAPIRDITFPAFSRIQNDIASLASGWLRTTKLVTAVVAPAMLGMMVVAPDFVPVVLGDRWLDAVPVLQALSWVGIMLSIQQTGGASTLLARDRSGTLVRFTVASAAANVLAFVGGLHWGIVGVAIGYAVVATAATVVLAAIVARNVGSSLGAFVRAVARPLAASAVMAIVVFASRRVLVGLETPQAVRLVASILIGCAVYWVLCARFVPECLVELRRLVPRRNRGAVETAS